MTTPDRYRTVTCLKYLFVEQLMKLVFICPQDFSFSWDFFLLLLHQQFSQLNSSEGGSLQIWRMISLVKKHHVCLAEEGDEPQFQLSFIWIAQLFYLCGSNRPSQAPPEFSLSFRNIELWYVPNTEVLYGLMRKWKSEIHSARSLVKKIWDNIFFGNDIWQEILRAGVMSSTAREGKQNNVFTGETDQSLH